MAVSHRRSVRFLLLRRPTAYGSPTAESPRIRARPMERITELFGRLLVLVYRCFDRIVILGYLPLLTRPEHMVYFFRDVLTRRVTPPRRGAESLPVPQPRQDDGPV